MGFAYTDVASSLAFLYRPRC